MSLHRTRHGRRDAQVPSPQEIGESAAVDRGVSVEEGFVPDVDTLPKPAGFGVEASTSNSSTVLVDEYEVPSGALARLSEVSLSIASNGEASVSVGGVTFGPYSGSLDSSVPFNDAVLTGGYSIRVFHRSTDGNSTTTKAQVVVEEV